MSHMLAIVLVPKGTEDVRAAVSALMKPWDEDDDAAYDAGHTFWDWWRVGGRWDRVLLSDHQTWMDHQCPLCEADNGLHNYSTEHEELTYNMVEVACLPEDVACYRILFPDGSTISRKNTCPECNDYSSFSKLDEHQQATGHNYDKPYEEWLPEMRNALIGYQDCVAVAVDYHV